MSYAQWNQQVSAVSKPGKYREMDHYPRDENRNAHLRVRQIKPMESKAYGENADQKNSSKSISDNNLPREKSEIISQAEQDRDVFRYLDWQERRARHQKSIQIKKSIIDAKIKALQSDRAMNRLEKLVKIRDLRKERGNL